MGRAYSIRPYSIGDFPAVYDHNLGPSSHPINPGLSLILVHPLIPLILVLSLILVHPLIPGWRAESSHDILGNRPQLT